MENQTNFALDDFSANQAAEVISWAMEVNVQELDFIHELVKIVISDIQQLENENLCKLASSIEPSKGIEEIEELADKVHTLAKERVIEFSKNQLKQLEQAYFRTRTKTESPFVKESYDV